MRNSPPACALAKGSRSDAQGGNPRRPANMGFPGRFGGATGDAKTHQRRTVGDVVEIIRKPVDRKFAGRNRQRQCSRCGYSRIEADADRTFLTGWDEACLCTAFWWFEGRPSEQQAEYSHAGRHCILTSASVAPIRMQCRRKKAKLLAAQGWLSPVVYLLR